MKSFSPLCSIAIMLLIFCSHSSSAQNIISGTIIDSDISKYTVLNEVIKEYELIEINILRSDIDVTKGKNAVNLNIGSIEYQLNLYDNNVNLTAEYNQAPHLLAGSLRYGGAVSLAVNDNFIFGFIKNNSTYIFIEPLRYLHPGAPDNIFVIYNASDVIDNPDHICGVQETEIHTHNHTPLKITDGCKMAQLAIADTYDMVASLGSVSAVIDHNLAILNNVQTNYRSEFDSNIEYDVVAHFVPATAGADPFPSTTDSDTLLTNFDNWGAGGRGNGGANGGFGVDYNIATLWTDRDICYSGNCGVVGLASGGPFNDMHHLLENFSASGATLNTLQTHEMGHNWNYDHDSPGATSIMAPALTVTDIWSPASKVAISSHIDSQTYLADCSTAGTPVSNFFSSISSSAICSGSVVTIDFEDQSVYGATRNWTFLNGSPSSSSNEKETVTYASSVTGQNYIGLESTNAAGTTLLQSYIDIQAAPSNQCIPANNNQNGGTTNITFSNINNSSTASGMYEDFSCIAIGDLNTSTTYTLDITTNISITQKIRVYADWNDNGDFTDSGELVLDDSFSNTGTFNITTPANPALNALIRFRVINSFNIISGPCHSTNFGQTEDYSVYFTGAPVYGCTDTAADNYNANATIDDGSCTYGNSSTWYRDMDDDNYGDPAVTQSAVNQPTGFVALNTDCDDTDDTVYPGAPELCDGQINDCNTTILPGIEIDNDNDGYVECSIDAGGWDGSNSSTLGDDCNDSDSNTYPGAAEICDGLDNNCNNQTDEGVLNTYYRDIDNDGYGDPNVTAQACTQPNNYVPNDLDCDDLDNTVYPGAPELCDGQINDCDSSTLSLTEIDNDNDGYVECSIDAGGWDGSNSSTLGDDCDDTDGNINPGATEVCDGLDNNCNNQTDEGLLTSYYRDIDNDGFGDPNVTSQACSQPNNYVTNNLDCNDFDNTVYPSAPELCDGQINDCNNSTIPSIEVDNDNDGYVECSIDAGGWDGPNSSMLGDDCDDTNVNTYPGATEICDGEDNNCDNQIDEGIIITYYSDLDSDGFGDPNVTSQACSQPANYVSNNTDCNDNDSTIYPGAPELCDGQINDCNSSTLPSIEIDNDNDGYVECIIDNGGWDGPNPNILGGDCDDNNVNINPGANEICDGIDNNCNNQIDEGTTSTTYYRDFDNDGYGDSNVVTQTCNPPSNYVANSLDCDDFDNTIYPGAPELCDGQINDCNSSTLPSIEIDGDNDGYVGCTIDVGGWDGPNPNILGDDCDDIDNTVYPGAPELCDGQINDCNTTTLPNIEVDNDNDGYIECTIDAGGWDGPDPNVLGGDCDDTDNNINPGATELCDGIDNNCNNQIDEGAFNTYYRDLDGDGFGTTNATAQACSPPNNYVANSLDCDDFDDTVYPGAPEICDGQINDCNNNNLPNDEVDNDNDGYIECTIDAGGWDGNNPNILGDDCDDTDASINPGATEICDGIDNNCNDQTDEGFVTTYYLDNDNDGFGDQNTQLNTCTPPTGYIADNTDCNDNDMTIYPGAPELCDGQINDCNTDSLPLDEIDNDSDGYVECTIDSGGWDGSNQNILGSDCDDNDTNVNPGESEVCGDNIDNDCDSIADNDCQECHGINIVINDGNIMAINRAELTIDSDALVNLSSVLYTAGEEIELTGPFEVVAGTEFEARIEPCIVYAQDSEYPDNARSTNQNQDALTNVKETFSKHETVGITVLDSDNNGVIILNGKHSKVYEQFLHKLTTLSSGKYSLKIKGETESIERNIKITQK